MKVHLFLLIPATFVAALTFGQSHHDLLDTGTRELLHEVLSGELAKEHVIAITASRARAGTETPPTMCSTSSGVTDSQRKMRTSSRSSLTGWSSIRHGNPPPDGTSVPQSSG